MRDRSARGVGLVFADDPIGLPPAVLAKAYYAAGYSALGQGDYVQAKPFFEESLEVVKKKLRISTEQERNLERSFDLLSAKYYEPMPYPSLRGVETVLGFLEKDNPKAKGADPKSFVDDSLLREIEQSGFVKTLYQK